MAEFRRKTSARWIRCTLLRPALPSRAVLVTYAPDTLCLHRCHHQCLVHKLRRRTAYRTSACRLTPHAIRSLNRGARIDRPQGHAPPLHLRARPRLPIAAHGHSPQPQAHSSDSSAAAAGTEALRITAGTNPGGEPACIWALACLPDGSLVSTSSRGTVQFWETQFGTALSSVQQHQADVNAVAVSPCGGAVFAAGVDPSLVLIKRETAAAAGGLTRFAFSDRRRPHTHDVRSMAVLAPPAAARPGGPRGASLLTGGNDAELLVHSVDEFTQHHPVRVTAAPCAPAVTFAANGRFVVADLGSLDVWQAAHADVHEQVRRQPHACLRQGRCRTRALCCNLGTGERMFEKVGVRCGGCAGAVGAGGGGGSRGIVTAAAPRVH